MRTSCLGQNFRGISLEARWVAPFVAANYSFLLPSSRFWCAAAGRISFMYRHLNCSPSARQEPSPFLSGTPSHRICRQRMFFRGRCVHLARTVRPAEVISPFPRSRSAHAAARKMPAQDSLKTQSWLQVEPIGRATTRHSLFFSTHLRAKTYLLTYLSLIRP